MRGINVRWRPATFTGIQSHARQLSWIFTGPEKIQKSLDPGLRRDDI